MEKARKLFARGEWSEAATWFEEALDADPGDGEAKEGLGACRRALVELNLKEAEAFAGADMARALDHARLAATVAGDDRELAAMAKKLLASLESSAPRRPAAKAAAREEAPKRMFAPTCGCAAPCGAEGEEGVEADIEDLFAFYLDAMSEEEQTLLEPLGPTFREGFVALQQGDGAEARKLLVKARREEKDAPGVLYALGLAEGVEGRIREAEKLFAEVQGKLPGFGPAVRQRASALRELNRPADAAQLLEAHLTAQPKDREALLLRAACLLDGERAEEAAALLEPVNRESGRTDATVAFLWARAREKLGDGPGAIGAYQSILARTPDALEALLPLGGLYLAEGKKSAEKAVKVFKHCYRIDPDRGWHHLLQVARGYALLGWEKDARKMLDAAEEELPDDKRAEAMWEEVSRALGSGS